MHTGIVDLNQVMNLLEVLNCNQIVKGLFLYQILETRAYLYHNILLKNIFFFCHIGIIYIIIAIFSYFCYDNGWFRKFQAIRSTTLTYLTVVWDVYPERNVFPTSMIKQFPNLSYFSLVLKDMGYCFRTAESLIPQLQRLLFDISHYTGMVYDDSNTFLSSSYHFPLSIYPHQHQNLTTLHIDLSTADFIIPFPGSILTVLPNLRYIKFTTHDCTGNASVIRTYESLYKYCTKIQTLSYNYISNP